FLAVLWVNIPLITVVIDNGIRMLLEISPGISFSFRNSAAFLMETLFNLLKVHPLIFSAFIILLTKKIVVFGYKLQSRFKTGDQSGEKVLKVNISHYILIYIMIFIIFKVINPPFPEIYDSDYILLICPILLLTALWLSELSLSGKKYRALLSKPNWQLFSIKAGAIIILIISIIYNIPGLHRGGTRFKSDWEWSFKRKISTGRWLSRGTLPSDIIGTPYPGFISFFSKRYILDLSGKVEKSILKYKKEFGDNEGTVKFIKFRKPDYIVADEKLDKIIKQNNDLFINTASFGSLIIYKCKWKSRQVNDITDK
ncbi:MAG: hypothetical protein KAS39_02070, partial [Actinomycetia bacterium]|nr:hypothetical protein [Actinomycetes bacterium]